MYPRQPLLAPARNCGFTLFEFTIVLSVAVIGVLSLGSVFLSVDRQAERSESYTQALSVAQGVLEEITASKAELVFDRYNGATHMGPGTGLIGANTGGALVEVDVDNTDSQLLVVTVSASWISAGEPQQITLTTRRYNANG